MQKPTGLALPCRMANLLGFLHYQADNYDQARAKVADWLTASGRFLDVAAVNASNLDTATHCSVRSYSPLTLQVVRVCFHPGHHLDLSAAIPDMQVLMLKHATWKCMLILAPVISRQDKSLMAFCVDICICSAWFCCYVHCDRSGRTPVFQMTRCDTD